MTVAQFISRLMRGQDRAITVWQSGVPQNWHVISEYLTPREILSASLVCKAWRAQLINNPQIWEWHAKKILQSLVVVPSPREYFLPLCPEVAFGREEWIRYMQLDPGPVRSLPPNIEDILRAQCPFWPQRKIKETHGLYWIPRQVIRIADGISIPVTLATIDSFPDCLYERILDEVVKKYGHVRVKGHWVLISKDVIPGSRDQSYKAQQRLVAAHPQYQLPSAIDAILMVFLENKRSKSTFLSRNPSTYTHCLENTEKYSVIIGGFSAATGLNVAGDCSPDPHCGVLGAQVF